MLLSSKRKFSKIEKTESTTPEMKRSRVSQTSNLSALHLDENIPQNMQKGSADHSPEVKKLANTDLIESPKDFEYQKPLRRSRLNLKKVKSGNQPRDPEDQKESERKTELHLRSKHGPTVFLKEYLKKIGDQVDADTFDGNDEESDLKCTRKHELTDIQCCPVCRSDVSLFESDIELNKHVNNCLDNLNVDSTSSRKTSTTSDYKEVYFCQICGKDMNRYSTIQRQQHLNRCCDNTEQAQNQATTSPKQLACLICGKIIKTFKVRKHWNPKVLVTMLILESR